MEQGTEVEARILAVLRRKRNYHKYRSILQPSFFQLETTRQIFSLVDEFFSTTTTKKKKLTTANLRLIIHQKIRNVDLRNECLEFLKKIRPYPTKDNEVIDESIKDFAKRQFAKRAVLECLELLEGPNPDFTSVQDHLEKAITISTSFEKECYSYFDQAEERTILDVQDKSIPSGIPRLDEILGGGTGQGELIVFLAPPERGKTLALVNFGTAALHLGLRIGYISLELAERKIARRFDLRITGRTYELLKKEPDRIKNPLAALRKNGCELVIKDYSASDPRLEDIKSFVVNYQNKMRRKFDMLIVDYADLISPTKMHKTERFGIKEVYTNLRRFANELKIPIITASQANRKSVGKLVVTMEDFAEDFAKAAVADVVIAICQTPEELEDDLCRLYVAKNRRTGRHGLVRLTMQPKVMYLGEMRKVSDVNRKSIADRI